MEGPEIVGCIVAIGGAISYIIILCLGGSMSVSFSGRRMTITKRMPVKIKENPNLVNEILQYCGLNLTTTINSLALYQIIYLNRNANEVIFKSENLQRVNIIINDYNLFKNPELSLQSNLPNNIKSELLSYLNEHGQKMYSDYILINSEILKSSPDKL